MASSGVGFSPSYCAHCGNRLDSRVKFCAGCGKPAGAASGAVVSPAPPAFGAVSHADDIGVLERKIAEHPGDEAYRKLLAVALHDDALKYWWQDPEDNDLLCVSRTDRGRVPRKTPPARARNGGRYPAAASAGSYSDAADCRRASSC